MLYHPEICLSGVKTGAQVAIALWLACIVFGGIGPYIGLIVLGYLCYTDLLDLLSTKTDEISDSNSTKLEEQSGKTVEHNDLTKCSSESFVIFWFLLVIITITSIVLLVACLFVCIREIQFTYSGLLRTYVWSRTTTRNIELTQLPPPSTDHIRNHRYVTQIEGSSELSLTTQLVHSTWKYGKRLGKDSNGLSHNGIKVKQVLVVNNEGLLQQYNDNRATYEHLSEDDLPDELQQHPILTSLVDTKDNAENDDPQNTLLQACTTSDPTEVFLLHGTRLECIPSILEEGFDLNRARSGLYGKAIYLAESSEKADQYCDYSTNRRRTNLAMIVARVNLGRVFIHKEEGPVNLAAGQSATEYHTVVAGFNKRFREFLVLDQKNVYPQYVIIYDRC